MLIVQQVDDLYQVFEEHENQFPESSKDLIMIDACDIIDNSVITTIETITAVSQSQFEAKCRFYPLLLSGGWQKTANSTWKPV